MSLLRACNVPFALGVDGEDGATVAGLLLDGRDDGEVLVRAQQLQRLVHDASLHFHVPPAPCGTQNTTESDFSYNANTPPQTSQEPQESSRVCLGSAVLHHH